MLSNQEEEGSKHSEPLTSAVFSFRLIFDPEDGGDMFIPNMILSPDYTALQPTSP
jgi:hypothetical protein